MNLNYCLEKSIVFCTILFFVTTPADAWKPKQHIHQGNEAAAELFAGHNYVTINGKQYPVAPEVAEAIRNYPAHFHGGCAGPDGFPDLTFGQMIIHPQWKSSGGTTGTYTHEWMEHVYSEAWSYYYAHGGNADAQKALAFAYGFLIHCGGDLWGHTLINSYSGGRWPDDMVSDLDIAIRHVVVEEYISKHTPPTDMSFSAPGDFIYETFIDNPTSYSMAQGASLNDTFGIPYFISLRADLVWQKNNIPWYEYLAFGYGFIKEAYLNAWINDIDDGLDAWPGVMTQFAKKMFAEDDFDGAMDVLESFTYDHLLSMYGSPDFVGDALELFDGISDWVEGILGFDIPGFSDIIVWAVESAYGIDFSDLKDYFKHPENYINQPPLFASGTSDILDELMYLGGGEFDPYLFAANKNSIVTAKLALLNPETLNALLADLGVGPLYGGANGDVPPIMQENAVMGFIRSIDWSHQWLMFSPETGLPHSEGMLLWVDCQAREKAFRVLFTDWEQDGFPDSEICICYNNPAPVVEVGGDITVDEGDAIAQIGSFTDQCSDSWTAAVDYGDGSGAEELTLDGWSFLLNHAYGDNGTYTVTVEVTDDEGAIGSNTLTVTVLNVAPATKIDSYISPVEGCILPGQIITFGGSFSDPGWLDTHTAQWDFGDGVVISGMLVEENAAPDATGTVLDTHVYINPGIYTTTLTVTDDDGGMSTDQIEIKVMTATEAVGFMNDFVQSLDDQCFRKPAEKRKMALENKFNAVCSAISANALVGSAANLLEDIRQKADGSLGGLELNDWIICVEQQQHLCLMVDMLVEYLELLMAGEVGP